MSGTKIATAQHFCGFGKSRSQQDAHPDQFTAQDVRLEHVEETIRVLAVVTSDVINLHT